MLFCLQEVKVLWRPERYFGVGETPRAVMPSLSPCLRKHRVPIRLGHFTPLLAVITIGDGVSYQQKNVALEEEQRGTLAEEQEPHTAGLQSCELLSWSVK